MSFSPEFIHLLQDSTEIDSSAQLISGNTYEDSLSESSFNNNIRLDRDTVIPVIQKPDSIIKLPKTLSDKNTPAISRIKTEPKDTTANDTNSISLIKDVEQFDRYHLFKESDTSYAYKPFAVFYTGRDSINKNIESIHFQPRDFQRSKYSWALIIGFISLFLLLLLKTYYQKSMAQVMNTLVNFQLSEKMLREKNIIVRRAFFILNLNYILVFSLFVLLILNLADFRINDDYFISYTLITGSVIFVLLARLILLFLTGIVFNSVSVISEYIHNIYLINKNLGIILLPLIFAALYTSANISKIIIFTGLVIVCIATLFKYIRGLQIIIKNDILKFYSFLYLCTLELLPLVVSFKIIITLR
jgi:hypothetical protein